MDDFRVDIINHCWIDNDPENDTDECSHGQFILTIAGTEILTKDDEILDWTTSTSVLRLLRTIGNDFIENRGSGIILHCGMVQMISCPISIDWKLYHENNNVVIKEVKKYPSVRDEDVINYEGLVGIIHIDDYKEQIIKVARQVKDFFAQSKPRRLEGIDVECNLEFWKEFDDLLQRHSS